MDVPSDRANQATSTSRRSAAEREGAGSRAARPADRARTTTADPAHGLDAAAGVGAANGRTVVGSEGGTDGPGMGPTAGREPRIDLRCEAAAPVGHVGIVFVHGIGSQAAGETLLDWGGAIVRALLDTRLRWRVSGDPVIDVQLEGGPSQSRWIEVQLPAVEVDGESVAEQHWVMTEAWWAQRVRPPSFGQMAEWLGPRGAIRRILAALLPRRGGAHDPRLRGWAEQHGLRRRDDGGTEEIVAPGPPDGMARPPGRGPSRTISAIGAGMYLQAVSALLLVLYGLLRAIEKLIPIGPLRDGALTRPLDRFVLEWFGDVYVLLSDAAQTASIRGRLVDAITDLRSAGCDEIVVVAHSGGAIVTYMTLADPSSADLPVDGVITLGEGLNLAWRLTSDATGDEGDGDIRPERLYRPVLESRPHLTWHDFWASQDPAPVGVMDLPPVDDPVVDAATLARIQSHSIWNRLSFREDHGAYWDNDEEFLLPVLGLIAGGPAMTTVFGDAAADRERSNRRRRRLSLLSYWRQLTAASALAAVVLSFALGTGTIAAVADAVTALFGYVPGSDAVAGFVTSLRALGLETTPLGGLLAETGVWVVAAAIALSAAYTLIAPPERPVPWAHGRYAPVIGRALRLAPWVGGIPISLAILVAAYRFVSGSSIAAIDAGRLVAVAAVVAAVLALGARRLVGDGQGPRAGWRDATDAILMMAAMVVTILLVTAPVVAILVYPDVGRAVVGTLAIVGVFQALGRAGTWRWSVWDARERALARTGREYTGLGRVAVQVALLGIALVLLLVGVVFNAGAFGAAAVASVVVVALVGVSVDVLDAAHPRSRTSAVPLGTPPPAR